MDDLRIRLAEAGIGVALITDDDSVHRRSKVRCWGQSGRTGGMVLTSVFSQKATFSLNETPGLSLLYLPAYSSRKGHAPEIR
jgi:hypothetical protein